MSESKLGKRYAEALYNAAVEAKNVDLVMQSMTALEEALKKPEILQFWVGPQIPMETKLSVMGKALAKAPEIVQKLLHVLLVKKRAEIIMDLIASLHEIHDRKCGIVRATLVTAIPLKDQEIKPFEKILAKSAGGKLVLTQKVDSSIIGGFKLKFSNKIIDASIVRSIDALRRKACA